MISNDESRRRNDLSLREHVSGPWWNCTVTSAQESESRDTPSPHVAKDGAI